MLKEAFSRMPAVFNSALLSQGQMLYEKDRVLSTRLSDGLLRGRVKGPVNQIFDVYMDLKSWPGTPATCTCSQQKNCEHAVACLIFLNNCDLQSGQKNATSTTALDGQLHRWLQTLTPPVQEKQPLDQILIYQIAPAFHVTGDVMLVKLALAKILKKGGLGKKTRLTSISDSKKQFFTREDEEIVAELLFKSPHYGWFDTLKTHSSSLLEKILKTGRAYAMEKEDLLLKPGEACIPNFFWELSLTGQQHFIVKQQGHTVTPLLLDESWYVDSDNQQLGKLITPYPVFQLNHLLHAPPVELDQAATLAQKMAEMCPDLPRPVLFAERKTVVLQPLPVLILDIYQPPHQPLLFIARLEFDYAGMRIIWQDKTPVLTTAQDNQTLLEYPRDDVFEAEVVQKLQTWLQLRDPTSTEAQQYTPHLDNCWILRAVQSDRDIPFLYDHFIPQWKEAGWEIVINSESYQEQCQGDAFEWFSEVEASGNDFFSWQTGILVDGKAVNIVPLVADLIGKRKGQDLDASQDEEAVKLPLEDGRMLVVSMGRIKPLIRLILQFGAHKDAQNQSITFQKYQLMLLQEAEKAMQASLARWRGAETLKGQLHQLIACQDLPPIATPKGLQATLRDYQHQGLNWLQFLRTTGFSGILADDMGLGKTVQTLALLQYEKEASRLSAPSLIIAPTSLMGNWQAEALKFTPDLKVLVFHGLERHEDDFANYDLIVSTYGLIQRDKARFLQQHFYYLILDEAQFIKNARTKTTQIIQQLQAEHRLCLSGTPMENHLGELWSLFHFLMPGLLGDMKQFGKWFKTPIEKYQDEERRHLLIKRVQPFMLRRTKNAVMRELPPKTEMIHSIDLIDKQRDLYEAIRMSMEKKVRDAIARQGLGKSHIILLDALLKLRQVCCDPRLLSLPEASMAHGYSAKLDALMELLENLMEEGRKVLIFSQFTSMLALIEKALQAKNYQWIKLTGETRNRQQLVETFQQGEVPIFLISLKAGGTGLNLTRADTVIHYDPWWNPAVEEQATDRSHRIGQENPVFVYKLITAGTVEEAILKLQDKKRQLVQGILSDNNDKLSLTEHDIDSFFMPLP